MRILVIAVLAVCMRFQEAHSTSFDHRFLGIERIEKVQGETSSLVRAPCFAGQVGEALRSPIQ